MITNPAPDAPAWEKQIRRLEGAFSAATLRAYRQAWGSFAAFCTEIGESALPATPETVARFVAAEAERINPVTIKKHVYAIKKMHRLMRLPDPVDDEEVVIAIRRVRRTKGTAPRQALGLSRTLLERMLEACDPATLVGLRDRALLLTMYDSACRRSEIAALTVDDLEPVADGGMLVFVRRSKTDIAGRGRHAYLSARAAEAIADWRKAAGVVDDNVFRNVRNREASFTGLSANSVGWIVKRAARRAGLSDTVVAGLTSHSGRVGRAQDLSLAGADVLTIMRAGGWKSVEVVARYTERAELQRLARL